MEQTVCSREYKVKYLGVRPQGHIHDPGSASYKLCTGGITNREYIFHCTRYYIKMVINSGPRTDTLPIQIQNGLKDQTQRENVLPVTLLSGFLVRSILQRETKTANKTREVERQPYSSIS